MKKLLVLITWIAMSFTGFSQSLTPKVEVTDADTFFCFTLPQARIIAQELVHAEYADSIISALEEKNCLHEEIILSKDSIILAQNAELANQLALQKSFEGQVAVLSEALIEEQKKTKQHKRINWITGIGVFLLGITAAAK